MYDLLYIEKKKKSNSVSQQIHYNVFNNRSADFNTERISMLSKNIQCVVTCLIILFHQFPRTSVVAKAIETCKFNASGGFLQPIEY